jgi:hypothetical protein
MRLQDYRVPSTFARDLIILGVVVVLVLVVLISGTSTTYEDDPTEPVPGSVTSVSEGRSSRPTQGSEVVSRLREILRIREEAYRSRSPEMLHSIYSNDCPCLRNDEKAISELLSREHIWEGITTSIDVQSVVKVNDYIWIVRALFRSEPLSILAKDGKLVRTEPAGSDLFVFTLVKPQEDQEWVLGSVSAAGGR